jgi:putative hydrolase of the HAD superfamily
MIRAIFLDLDNTLYDQDLYFSSAYSAIARHIEKCFSFPSADTLSRLRALLREKGSMYSTLFDDLLESIGFREEKLVRLLVELFHHAPVDTLVPYEDAGIVLPRMAQKFLLGIITNGHAEMQRRKVAALDLSELLPFQIYTAEMGHPKPSVRCYEYAIEMANVDPQESLYVGDNPYVDFTGARQIGMHTIRLLRGEFMSIMCSGDVSDAQVRDFYELEDVISSFSVESMRGRS